MKDVIDLLRNTGLSGWVAFAVVYHYGTRGAWRRSRVGPWIMALCVVPLLTLLTGIISVMLGMSHPLSLAARLVLMITINIMPLWLAVLFVRRQREIGELGDGKAESEGVRESDSSRR